MNAPLISSQRHVDHELVARKAERFAVFIVHVADVTLRGKPYRLVIDGHHNLAAAKLAGMAPVWRAPAVKWQRIQRSMSPAQFERFLINNLTDSEYYFVDTGEVVQELLGVEPARTTDTGELYGDRPDAEPPFPRNTIAKRAVRAACPRNALLGQASLVNAQDHIFQLQMNADEKVAA